MSHRLPLCVKYSVSRLGYKAGSMLALGLTCRIYIAQFSNKLSMRMIFTLPSYKLTEISQGPGLLTKYIGNVVTNTLQKVHLTAEPYQKLSSVIYA